LLACKKSVLGALASAQEVAERVGDFRGYLVLQRVFHTGFSTTAAQPTTVESLGERVAEHF